MDKELIAGRQAAPQLPCTNLTEQVEKILRQLRHNSSKEYYDDSRNSYQYIVFVLVIYSVSFLALMVKYFWRSHESKRNENLYEEFVKRDRFRTIDNKGARGRYMDARRAAPVTEQVSLAELGAGTGATQSGRGSEDQSGTYLEECEEMV